MLTTHRYKAALWNARWCLSNAVEVPLDAAGAFVIDTSLGFTRRQT